MTILDIYCAMALGVFGVFFLKTIYVAFFSEFKILLQTFQIKCAGENI